MTLRKRIGVLTIGGSGGGTTPTFGNVAWGPNFGGADGDQFKVQAAIDLSALTLSGDLDAQAAISMPSLALDGDTAVQAALSMPSLALDGDTGVNAAMTGSYVINDIPPSDDTYLDEASPNTNFGTATGLLCKTNGAVGQNQQHSYVAWDFTGWSGTPDTAEFDIEMSTTAVLGENASLEIYTDPTQPIDEATATWNNSEPPAGTLRETITQAVTTTTTVYTLTFGSATRSNMFGNWLYIRCIGTGLLGASTITITSKEGTNGPLLDLTGTLA